jgi:hypothetical protein
MPTFDYYFNKNECQPYLGAGVGICIMSDIDVAFIAVTPPVEIIEVGVNNQIGFLFRDGLESKNFRLGFEYEFYSFCRY